MPRTRPPQASSKRRRIRKLRLFGLLLILFVLGSLSFTFGLVTSIASEVPSLDPARLQQREVDGYVYDSKGQRILAVLRGSQSRILVASKDIAPLMKQAIVAIEDKRFYEHRGVDVHGIMRAVWQDVRNQRVVEGGSTITQQFVKNTYIKSQRSIGRKLKEAALAWQLEQRWSKDRILTAYLNTIYFGNGAYGIQQAALTYFRHSADELRLAEGALLAGIPADPARYDPVANPRAARQRRDVVLRAMLDQGDITYRDYASATRARLPRAEDVHLSDTGGPAPYFTNYVKQQLIDRYGSGRVFGGGLHVKTTIDLNVQRFARQAITKWLTDPNGPSAALVAVDPRDGSVLAMIGGNNYRKSQFNLAVQGERQPGSSFKPFVLATALRGGISPDSEFESGPVQIPLGDKVWYVRNYENSDLGRISLATATEFSDNTVYAQLTQLVGPGAIVRTAKRLGITSPLKNYFAIGLGAEAVNPLEMARGFSAFANGGRRIDGAVFGNRPRAVSIVRNEAGRIVDDNRAIGRPVLTENTAALVTSLLQSVVTGGTGRQAQLSDGRPVAGKTGTTENYGDAWFVGYTPQLVTAVWVGYPNQLRPMLTEYHGKAVAGGTFPALIWKSFMESALAYLHEEPQDFPSVSLPYAVPKQVVYRNGRLELDNGNCHSTKQLLYFEGQGPARTANCKVNEVEVPRLVGQTVTQANLRLAAQPLTPQYVYEPAKPRQRLGIVLRQYPARGTLSSYDKVTLVLPKALHGIVPRLIGLGLGRAQARLERLHLKWKVSGHPSPGAKVIAQTPGPRRAAKPGLVVTLVVKGG
ncbi:MAG: PBP1A family penicillin-binding protein [Actinomycetota bacterium]|nr:PBP1A family penicillin-binding protein [Actinomycetota bacterium]MDQ2980812.1 PBP1A family penicillin-binding protein [Actinomycetota bacterium]